MMTIWAVYRVSSLLSGHSGQCLTKIGRVDADSYSAAMETAQRRWPNHINPDLPQGGLTVIASRNQTPLEA